MSGEAITGSLAHWRDWSFGIYNGIEATTGDFIMGFLCIEQKFQPIEKKISKKNNDIENLFFLTSLWYF